MNQIYIFLSNNLLIFITAIVLLISLIANPNKTYKAIKLGLKKFLKILLPFILILIIISFALFFITDELISKSFVGKNRLISLIIAIALGSISLMPGFIVFPFAGLLIQKGVSYIVISAFTTTLMMVGLLTLPLENKFFGFKVAILRNIVSLIIALIISFFVGILYGEII